MAAALGSDYIQHPLQREPKLLHQWNPIPTQEFQRLILTLKSTQPQRVSLPRAGVFAGRCAPSPHTPAGTEPVSAPRTAADGRNDRRGGTARQDRHRYKHQRRTPVHTVLRAERRLAAQRFPDVARKWCIPAVRIVTSDIVPTNCWTRRLVSSSPRVLDACTAETTTHQWFQ